MKKIIAIADTHGLHDRFDIPDGNIIIHCGDFSSHGQVADTIDFLQWYEQLPHEFKYLISGNHDWLPYKEPVLFQELLKEYAPSVRYLEDSSCAESGLMIYGTPWTPEFMDWAFMKDTEGLKKIRQQIPTKVDILIAHGPPEGILDQVMRDSSHVGCLALRHRIEKIKPKYVLFGHIHESRGHISIDSVDFYNCSMVNFFYRPIHFPYVIEMEENHE